MSSISGGGFSSINPLHRIIGGLARAQDNSLLRLSTGIRLNRGSDGPAALIASENLMSTLATLSAESNSLERVDQVANTADGALQDISDLLGEAHELAVASANDAGMSPEEKQANQMQMDSILSSVNRLASSSTFNGQHLFDGELTLSAGAHGVDVDHISTGDIGEVTIDTVNHTLADVGSGGSLNLVSGDVEGAQQSIEAAQSQVANLRGRIGAFQSNYVRPAQNAMRIGMENIAAANSMIRDTDYAAEVANLTRLDILSASAYGALGHSLKQRKSILSLLG